MASPQDQSDTVAGAEHPDISPSKEAHQPSAIDTTSPTGTSSVEMSTLGTRTEPADTTPTDNTTTQPSNQIQPAMNQTTLSIPESSEKTSPTDIPAGPSLSLILLLITGSRHAYKVDGRYLRSRNMAPTNAAGELDPFELSGYQLKELIWTDWRSDWEAKPATPSSIRLIILGRMIEDKSSLKDFPFKSTADATNVVHMTVRPADLLEDDEAAGSAKLAGAGSHRRSRRAAVRSVGDEGEVEERGAGCRCVIL